MDEVNLREVENSPPVLETKLRRECSKVIRGWIRVTRVSLRVTWEGKGVAKSSREQSENDRE
jgi:hypothetical protein